MRKGKRKLRKQRKERGRGKKGTMKTMTKKEGSGGKERRKS